MRKTTDEKRERRETYRGVRVEAISFTKVAVGLLGLLLSGAAWLLRRTVKRFREEREMLLELYAYNFGAEELGMALDDDSVEERLERGNERFDMLVEGQRRIYRNQEKLAESLSEDVEMEELSAEHDRDRYRDERRSDG
jgi:hypothetical protein